MNVGSTPVTVTFTPTDTKDYTPQTVTATITVTPRHPHRQGRRRHPSLQHPKPHFTGTISGAVNTDTFTETFATHRGPHLCRRPLPPSPPPPSAQISATTPSPRLQESLLSLRASATITWAPVTVTYGSATIGAGSLTATSSVPGSFTYSPAAGIAFERRINTRHRTFTPTDTKNYTTQTVTATITVTPATLNVKAADATRAYNTPNPTFTGTISGAVNTDTFTETFATTAVLTLCRRPLPHHPHRRRCQSQQLHRRRHPRHSDDHPGCRNHHLGSCNRHLRSATIGAGSLIATSSIHGSFTYSPAAGIALNVGSTPVTATLHPPPTPRTTPLKPSSPRSPSPRPPSTSRPPTPPAPTTPRTPPSPEPSPVQSTLIPSPKPSPPPRSSPLPSAPTPSPPPPSVQSQQLHHRHHPPAL